MLLNILTNFSDPLRPIFDSDEKVAFSIFGLSVAWYAIIILSGAIIGTCIGYFGYAKKLKLDSDTLLEGMTIGILVGIIGARLYYVAFNFQNMGIQNFIDVINPRDGGLAIHGAILGEAIFIPIYCKVKHLKLLTILEIAMPLILFAQVIGRWGNFMNQEAFGELIPFTGNVGVNGLSDAQLLEQRNFLSDLSIPKFIIDRMYIASSSAQGFSYAGYYQPTFLYESFFNLIGLSLYTILRKNYKKIYVGDGLSFYLIWYGIVRFFIELMRTDPLTIGNTGIRIAVVTSIIYFVIGVALLIIRRVTRFHLISCQEALYNPETYIYHEGYGPNNKPEKK